jgi:hypothetical protein
MRNCSDRGQWTMRLGRVEGELTRTVEQSQTMALVYILRLRVLATMNGPMAKPMEGLIRTTSAYRIH